MYLSAMRLHRTLRNYLLILDLQRVPGEPLHGALPAERVEESIKLGVSEVTRLNKREKDVTLRVERCSLTIKPRDLTHVVEELVDNACKFSRQGTPVEVGLSADGHLTVTDQGKGLTIAEIDRIGVFQQFNREKEEQQGLGLGLVLVQKLAASSKAEFSIKSEPGKGTQVRVAIPVG